MTFPESVNAIVSDVREFSVDPLPITHVDDADGYVHVGERKVRLYPGTVEEYFEATPERRRKILAWLLATILDNHPGQHFQPY